MKIDAVVLAGRENTGKLADVSPEKLEANIDIAGKPMVMYILGALMGVPRIGQIYLVGPRDGLSQYETERVRLVEPSDNLFDNVQNGLRATATQHVIVAASDVPLVTAEMIEGLLDKCLSSEADFCYPVASKEECVEKFSDVTRTYAALKEGQFTGGNVFFVRKDVVARAWPVVEKMLAYRKQPLKMASVLGLGLLLRVFLKQATIGNLEARVGDILGLKPKAILGCGPEIAVDVDKPSDLDLCRRVLSK